MNTNAARAFKTRWDLEGFTDFLVEKKIASRRQAHHLRTLCNAWGSNLIEVCTGTDLLTHDRLADLLSEFFGISRFNERHSKIHKNFLTPKKFQECFSYKAFPIRESSGEVWVVCVFPSAEVLSWAELHFGFTFKVLLASENEILFHLRKHYSDTLSYNAREKLFDLYPEDSAKFTLTKGQRYCLSMVPLFFIGCGFYSFTGTLLTTVTAINCFYLFTICFRSLLTFLGDGSLKNTEVSMDDLIAIDERELPYYTVMVAMYKEAAVLPILVQHLRELNYPRSKLEIKIILEEDDKETLEVAKQLRVENFFEFVVVPASQPKTKPKAMNFALPFAKGEFLTIYDAEDRPDPDQLLKAFVVFKRHQSVACVQARLNYFNAKENALTRMFTMEYSQWFDYFLIGLYRLGVPIPLGGTSNHFRTKVLRDLGGWDPYNVTEDADLGVRFEKHGHRVAIVNSTTYEEATTQVKAWVRQRSRWLKGHMQTFLVHLRHPVKLYKEIGPVGVFGFVVFIGGPCFVALFNPILWAIVTITTVLAPFGVQLNFSPAMIKLTHFNLIFGNLIFMFLGAYGLKKRKLWSLMPWAVCLPFYWLLQSAAAYKALWQLIFKPHFWEKTTHGLSAQMKAERELALRAFQKKDIK